MSRALRVVHLPARTPYVRKITSAEFVILNGAATEHGVVPTAVSAQWLLDRRPLDWLDVLHLHHLEFDDVATLERLLTACADSSVKVVYTAHDLVPMFGSSADFQSREDLMVRSGTSWVALTAASVDALNDRLPGLRSVAVIPHGYVADPDDLADARRDNDPDTTGYLLYGALRPNRDHLATMANWSLSVTDPNARLNLLLRGLSPIDFARHNVPALIALARSDPRIQMSMRGYHSDRDITNAGLHADALLMPYLFGSHSGQLELAFDLNLVAICSSVGYLQDQYRVHKGLVGEPVWFDWSDGHPFLFGEKFVAALEVAHRRLTSTTRRGPNQDFLEYRREEHRRFLDAHAGIYAA